MPCCLSTFWFEGLAKGPDSSNLAEHAKNCAASRSQALSAVRFDAERKQKCAIHAKKRAVLERVLALSASRFGGERVRHWAGHAKKWVFCAAMCSGKDKKHSVKKRAKKRNMKGRRLHVCVRLREKARNVGAALGAVCGAFWCRADA